MPQVLIVKSLFTVCGEVSPSALIEHWRFHIQTQPYALGKALCSITLAISQNLKVVISFQLVSHNKYNVLIIHVLDQIGISIGQYERLQYQYRICSAKSWMGTSLCLLGSHFERSCQVENLDYSILPINGMTERDWVTTYWQYQLSYTLMDTK